MKVVQINTKDIRGGAARAAYRLHRGLLQNGEDCRMLVRDKFSNDESVFSAPPRKLSEEIDEGLFFSTVIQRYYINSHRTDISNTIFSFPYPGWDLSTFPMVQATDIVNLHWVANYQSPLSLQKLFALGKPVVWTLHDQWTFTGGCHYAAGCEKYLLDCSGCPQLAEDPFNLPATVLKDKLELFQGANLTIVTPSRWLADCASKSKLFKDLRVEVIPYSLETEVFRPLPKVQAKERMGLAADTVTLLFGVERGDEKRKGFRELTAAIQYCLNNAEFQNLIKRDKIRIISFGHRSDEIEGLRIPVPVIVLGYLNSDEEIRAAYTAGDIFVLPSLEDNLPNTLLEAMSCGVPVVAFDVGGMPDVIASGVTGQLVSKGDVQQMGEAILSLIFDPLKREVLGQNCRKLMVKEYSLTIQARRYAELYKELHRESKSSPQIATEGSTAEPEQRKVPVKGETAEVSCVCLETSVGPDCKDIYDKVLLKALKEFALATRETWDKLAKQESQIKRQSEQLRHYKEERARYVLQLKQRDQQLATKEQNINTILNSYSYKSGRIVVYPFGVLTRLLKRLKDLFVH